MSPRVDLAGAELVGLVNSRRRNECKVAPHDPVAPGPGACGVSPSASLFAWVTLGDGVATTLTAEASVRNSVSRCWAYRGDRGRWSAGPAQGKP